MGTESADGPDDLRGDDSQGDDLEEEDSRDGDGRDGDDPDGEDSRHGDDTDEDDPDEDDPDEDDPDEDDVDGDNLHARVSLVLGIVAVVTVLVAGRLGIGIPLFCGGLAVTLGWLGLSRGASRVMCLTGLISGGVAVLYLGCFLIVLAV